MTENELKDKYDALLIERENLRVQVSQLQRQLGQQSGARETLIDERLSILNHEIVSLVAQGDTISASQMMLTEATYLLARGRR